MTAPALTLKTRLPRTWSPFFARHGNFTPAQLAAIPPLLDGHNVILCAATASGKTEAALAPLIERHLPPARNTQHVSILYLLPTRALIADIAQRLATPLATLRVTLAVKTRDRNDFDPRRPADLLLTTPESLDALLAAKPKTLTHVAGVVLDELHVLDGGVRGDQLRAVLARLRQVRAYAAASGDAPDAQIQYAALSATLAEPGTAAARYFPAAQVVSVPGGRDLAIATLPLAADSAAALLDYLATFRVRGWRKGLVFCNTRAEVEAYATAVRTAGSPFGNQVFVHYSNLERQRRREIEEQFAQADAALCFASSTLELGIDIGSIDVAILIGAPGSAAAFAQRIGRAGRRQRTIQAAAFYRTPLEEALLRALIAAPEPAPSAAPFRPSVAVQQIFSLLLQSPTGALRLQPLADLFAGLLTAADVETILGHLHQARYLTTARAGEWRAGDRLKRLVDQQASEHAPLSLYSNIQNRTAMVQIRDQQSQQVVATVDPLWLDREVLTLEGRPLDVGWFDGEALWVTAHRGAAPVQRLPYLSARQLLSFDLAQQLPVQLGLASGAAPLVAAPDGWLLFHFLGDVYGQALLDLLHPLLAVSAAAQPGLALLLREEPRTLPTIGAEQVTRYLHEHVRAYEGLLALGAYNHLLPIELRRRAVVEQFGVARFVEGVAALKTERTPEELSEDLRRLVAED
jgi:ATP-dependent Lhr-like helicase